MADLVVADRAAIAEGLGAHHSTLTLGKVDIGRYYEARGAMRFLRGKRSEGELFRYLGYAPDSGGQYVPYTLRYLDEGTVGLGVDNRGVMLRLQDVQGYNPVHIARYDRYLAAMNGRGQDYHDATVFANGLRSPLLDALNARYIVVPSASRGGDEVSASYRAVYEDGDARVLENGGALPRAWLVHSARRVGGGEGLRLLASGAVSPRRTVLLEAPPPRLAPPSDPAADSVRVLGYAPDRIVLRTRTGSPGMVVLGDIYYPGWATYLDGKRERTYLADYTLRATRVPPGEHTLVVWFESPTLRAGIAISILSYALLAAALTIARLRLPKEVGIALRARRSRATTRRGASDSTGGQQAS